MKRRLRRTVLLSVGLIAGVVPSLGVVPAAAAHAATHTSSVRPHDYAADMSDPGSAGAKAAQAAQCALPVSRRLGAWVCVKPGNGVAPTPSRAVRERAAPATTSYCGSNGCYYRYGDYLADFDSYLGYWGFSGRTLGFETTYVQWTLTGATTVSKPVQYKNSVPTTNVIFVGDLLNTAPGANGSSVAGAYSVFVAGSVPASYLRSWTPNGYKTVDKDNFDHSQVNEFT